MNANPISHNPQSIERIAMARPYRLNERIEEVQKRSGNAVTSILLEDRVGVGTQPHHPNVRRAKVTLCVTVTVTSLTTGILEAMPLPVLIRPSRHR
jgi:hypothetical protein